MVTSPIGLCRSCRLAMPAHAAATAGFSTQEGEIPLETDCLLEGTGFEPSVPREAPGILVVSVVVRADFSACRESSRSDEPASKTWSCHAEPMVRIRLSPAESPSNLAGNVTDARSGLSTRMGFRAQVVERKRSYLTDKGLFSRKAVKGDATEPINFIKEESHGTRSTPHRHRT